MIDAAQLTFTDADAPGLSAHLRLREVPSLKWWKDRPKATRYQLDAFPTFDEAWTLYLATLEGSPPAALEAVCHYAADVRQGRWVDRVEPEQALQAIYLAIAQATLPRARETYLEEIAALFDIVAAKVEAGAAVATTAFVDGAARFQKYITALRDDQRLYAEDLQRAQTWRLSIGNRSVKLLALDRPAATQFKLWARRRDDCALLLVRQADGTLVLSADPSAKLKVDWVAPLLSKLDVHPWYAGERHEGTLIASARQGTRLGFDDVRRVLKARVPMARAMLLAPVFVVLLATTLALLRPSSTPATGAKGTALPRAEVLNLLQRPDGPRSFESYALVAGVCGYTGEHQLESPCDDARAVKKALIERLGYPADHVLFFVDRPAEGEQGDGVPDAATLKLAVERFRERFPTADANSSFLFYYSGHGGYEKGARQDFGVLQPAGYFEHPDTPMATRGWNMHEIVDDLRRGVPSKHVMLVLDACYSGWAVGAKGDASLSPELRSLWAERAEVVLTAGTRGQRAWEWDGRSAFTRYFLEGLEQGDQNADQVVTDEELAGYLRRHVPAAVKEQRKAEQVPQFFRFDEALPKSGQFLFVRK